MSNAINLLSGGQDSTTCLYWAQMNFDEVIAVSIFYGQRHKAELDAAAEIAAKAGVVHRVLEIPALGNLGNSALVDSSKALTLEGGIPDKAMPQGLPNSFVPGRNALLLTLAGAIAVKEGAKDIVTGVCQTDYSGYPDCRREFIDSVETMLSQAMPSSTGPFKIHTPLMYMTKAETVRMARRLPGCWESLALSTTCYEGQRPGCGKCASCDLRAKGFAEAGEPDPSIPL